MNGRAARSTSFRDAVAERVVSVLGCWFVVGGGGNKAAEGVIGVGRGKHRAAEAAALFADCLIEKVLVALGEAGRRGCLALNDL